VNVSAFEGLRPPAGSDPPPTDKIDRRLLGIASVVLLGGFMSILDATIVNVAIRKLSATFDTPLTTTQWISTGYMLAVATIIPLTGWAADRFGTKRLYITSIILFLVGSALAGASWSMSTLILFRVLQGLGGGMIMPTGMTILIDAGGPQRMGRLMGIVGIPLLLGPILGPILGGFLADAASWRWIFLVNLPVGAIALYVASRFLASDAPKPHHALDWRGFLLLSPGGALFLYGLTEITAAGNFQSTVSDGCVLGGTAMVVAFRLHAIRRPGALIDIRLFGRRIFGAAALTTFLFGTALFATALLLPLYFTMTCHEFALATGLLIAVQAIGAAFAMPFSSRMTDETGVGNVVVAGLILVALSMAGLALIDAATSLWRIDEQLLEATFYE
jgi:EmrB/QacA subfamily drug resistance transporter